MSRPGSDAVVVELHWASLEVDDAALATFSETLSSAERDRAAALGDTPARRWFIADHGWRRVLLGARLGRDPGEVTYEPGADAKPRLAGGTGPHFNASRAGAVALYALSDVAEVGVDVEEVLAGDLTALSRRLFTPAERTAWEASPASTRRAALSACWSRKEAHGKAHGTGLVFPLSEIEVWAGDDRPVRTGQVVTQTVDVSEMQRCAVAPLVAAVAVIAPAEVTVAAPPTPVRLHPDGLG